MNHQKFAQQTITIVMILLFMMGCSTPETPGPVPSTPTPISPTPIPLTSTPISPTPVPTPEPPTPTPALPVLTDGTDTWRVTTVTVNNTVTMGPDTIDAGANMTFLKVEFECVTDKMPPFPTLSNPPGPDYNGVYVTDSQGEKHITRQIAASLSADLSGCETFSILFEAMPKERHGFRLYFADLPPIDLGQ